MMTEVMSMMSYISLFVKAVQCCVPSHELQPCQLYQICLFAKALLEVSLLFKSSDGQTFPLRERVTCHHPEDVGLAASCLLVITLESQARLTRYLHQQKWLSIRVKTNWAGVIRADGQSILYNA